MTEISESRLEEVVDIFLKEAKLPRPQGWSKSDDIALKRRCLSAFLIAINRLTPVQTVQDFNLPRLMGEAKIPEIIPVDNKSVVTVEAVTTVVEAVVQPKVTKARKSHAGRTRISLKETTSNKAPDC
jgi:hypothetical protein